MSKEPGAEEGEAQTRFPTEPGRLAERSFGALKWNYLGAAVRVIAQLVIGIILARLLGPEPFGLVAIAWFVVGLGTLIADLGFGSALIQSKRVHEHDTRYVFTVLVLVASTMTIIVVSLAGMIASIFRRPDAVPIIQALGLLFVIQAFGQVPASLLRRELNFRAVQIAQAGSYLLAYLCLGIPLAIIGWSVWSLVAAALAQAVLCSAMLFALRPHAVSPRFTSHERGLLGFGSKVMGSNLANFSINNIDTLIVGRAFGTVDLGLYNRALQLVVTPMSALMSNLSAVIFPAYSRARTNPVAIRKTFLASFTLIGLLLVPPFVVIAIVPEAVLVGLYGEHWRSAVPLLTPLSLATGMTGLLSLSGPLLNGLGRPGVELRAQSIAAVVTAIALMAASTFSLLALAWTLLGAFAFRFFLITRKAIEATDTSWLDVALALSWPSAVAAIAAIVVKVTDIGLAEHGLAPSGRLFVAACIGAVSLFAAVVGLKRRIFAGNTGWFLAKIDRRLPAAARWLLVAKSGREADQ